MNSELSLEAVRQQYRASLADLTFNSKPIITKLTILAQENIENATVIVQAIEEQIRRVHPRQKLPVFYLLDSICKNVRGVYINLFARGIVKTFLDTYFSVDQATQKNLERVLSTWKNGPKGPLYPPEVIKNIEHSLYKYYQRIKSGRPHAARNSPTPGAERSGHKSSAGYPSQWKDPRARPATINPNGTMDPRGQALHQVSATVDSASKTASPNGSVDKSNLLHEIQTLIVQKEQEQRQTPSTTAQNQIQLLKQLHTLAQSPLLQPEQVAIFRQQINQIKKPGSSSAPASKPSVSANRSSTQPNQASIPATNPAALVQNLMAFGLLDPSNITAIPNPAMLSRQAPSYSKPSGIMVRLTHEDIQRKRPGAVELLYEALALQCTTCGFRYKKDEAGRAKMDQHLDWHFRQNRRLKEKAKKIQSRTWFGSEEDWVHSRDSQSAQQQPAFFDQESNSTPQEEDDEKGLKELTIVVPFDHHGKPCPTCKEKFVSFWSDSEEEWMYKNAVLVGDVVYHATCHADAQKNDVPSEDGSMNDITNPSKKRKIDAAS
ncbi:hypothetical protein K493DRAFT_312463 [Basidiobolus meristosporus CBS 931.73]|uniref:CID domain-containing protein n=1 Tax=Basidiobolus meristosporus CBS 931.73 TaxID=1314790 RepID=A0A1Y1YU90_9FUNG|nr:hypothetical protein K493DRAFT_312463 [Basidiobolus meristosporus CBS 931.73]|eukprot:ORY01297.1 hypothetical protein K493DRAFT_312463 [Basidiobolus meristosporus CBS 931.73]